MNTYNNWQMMKAQVKRALNVVALLDDTRANEFVAELETATSFAESERIIVKYEKLLGISQ